MSRDDLFGYGVGVVSCFIYLLFFFTGWWSFVIQKALIDPFLYLFPVFNSPSIGMGGSVIFFPLMILGVFIYPLVLFLIAKALKVKIDFFQVIVGFLLSIVVANIIKLLFMPTT